MMQVLSLIDDAAKTLLMPAELGSMSQQKQFVWLDSQFCEVAI